MSGYQGQRERLNEGFCLLAPNAACTTDDMSPKCFSYPRFMDARGWFISGGRGHEEVCRALDEQ